MDIDVSWVEGSRVEFGFKLSGFKIEIAFCILYFAFIVRHAVCQACLPSSVTRKKSPKIYKSCPKMISLENDRFLTPLRKLPKNVWDLGKLIVTKGFQKLPKVQ